MKKFIRIPTFVLVLVIVCLCAVAALASSQGDAIEETHANTTLTAAVLVNSHDSTSTITFSPNTNEVQRATISAVYEIYYRRDSHPNLPGDYFTTTGYANTVNTNTCQVRLHKTISTSTYYGFSYATVTFYARLVSTNSTCEFTPDPITVYSDLF